MFRPHEYPMSNFLETLRAEYRRNGRDVEFLCFGYNADFLPIAASSTGNFVNTTDHDSDFIVFHTMQTAFLSGGSFVYTPSPNITIRITMDVSGRALQDRDSAIVNVTGKGGFPFVWPRPQVIPAKSSFTTTVTNQDAANGFNLRITYWGVKAIPRVFK